MLQKLCWETSAPKQGKKTIIDVEGKYILHEPTCENGKRLVSFAQIYDLIIVSTKFQHKNSTRNVGYTGN